MSDQPLPAETATTPQRPWLRKAALAAAVAVGLGFLGLWFATRNQETTDDAFIEANIVQISPHVGGYVIRVLVNDNQWVKPGDVLAEIDPKDYELRVQQAEAALAASQARHGAAHQDVSVVSTTSQALIEQAQGALESARALRTQAQAQARLAHADAVRYQALYQKDEVSRQRFDQMVTADQAAAAQLSSAEAQVAQAEARVAEARSGPRQVALKQAQEQSGLASVEEARAALEQARRDLGYTHLVAPVEGRVARRSIFQGQLLQSGPAVMAIVYGNPWVVANFKETQLRRMQVGQSVEVKVDAFPGRVFKAHVDSFQPGTGARFSLLPPENASGNFVKVVQRLPVKIIFDEKPDALSRLAPGMSVEPKVILTESTH